MNSSLWSSNSLRRYYGIKSRIQCRKRMCRLNRGITCIDLDKFVMIFSGGHRMACIRKIRLTFSWICLTSKSRLMRHVIIIHHISRRIISSWHMIILMYQIMVISRISSLLSYVRTFIQQILLLLLVQNTTQ